MGRAAGSQELLVVDGDTGEQEQDLMVDLSEQTAETATVGLRAPVSSDGTESIAGLADESNSLINEEEQAPVEDENTSDQR